MVYHRNFDNLPHGGLDQGWRLEAASHRDCVLGLDEDFIVRIFPFSCVGSLT